MILYQFSLNFMPKSSKIYVIIKIARISDILNDSTKLKNKDFVEKTKKF